MLRWKRYPRARFVQAAVMSASPYPRLFERAARSSVEESVLGCIHLNSMRRLMPEKMNNDPGLRATNQPTSSEYFFESEPFTVRWDLSIRAFRSGGFVRSLLTIYIRRESRNVLEVPVVFTRRAATTGEDRRSASRTAFGVAAFAGENLPLQLSGTPAAAERQALVSTCSRAGSLALSAPPARLVQQCSFSFFSAHPLSRCSRSGLRERSPRSLGQQVFVLMIPQSW